MKRLLVVLAVVGLGMFVALFPAPTVVIPSDTVPDQDRGVVTASVVHCPWVRADGFVGSEVALAGLSPFDATVSLAAVGEIQAERATGGLPFGVVTVSDLMQTAGSSAVVEFSSSGTGAVVMGSGEGSLISVGCAPTGPTVWQLAGGSTLTGDDLELRLFNPFPQDALVEIRVTSENDLEPEATLESVSVRAMSTRVIDIGASLDLRQVLAMSISDPSGLVVPAFIQTEQDGDTAGWIGAAATEQWDFPFTSSGATKGTLVLTNDEPVQVAFDIDAYTPSGGVSQVWQGVLEPRTVIEVSIDEMRSALPDSDIRPFGIRVRADAPIGAFLLGNGTGPRAAMTGLTSDGLQWIVAGPGGAESDATVWIMNPGTAPATVSIQRSSNDGGLLSAEKMSVAPGSVMGISTVRGMILGSDQPISVAWIGGGVGTVSYTSGLGPFDG